MFSINSFTFAVEFNDRVKKKVILMMLCSSLVMGSCDTYTGSGAYAGGSIGSILGSAIGGLSGGPRGSDMGTIIGMAGGAAVGAVIGSMGGKTKTTSFSRTASKIFLKVRMSNGRVREGTISVKSREYNQIMVNMQRM